MTHPKTREATNRILEMVEEGILDRDTVILACLGYMSESEVKDMAHANEFFVDDDEEEDQPPCLVDMGCLCWGHASGNAVDEPCDAVER